jgi:hypothetical protein
VPLPGALLGKRFHKCRLKPLRRSGLMNPAGAVGPGGPGANGAPYTPQQGFLAGMMSAARDHAVATGAVPTSSNYVRNPDGTVSPPPAPQGAMGMATDAGNADTGAYGYAGTKNDVRDKVVNQLREAGYSDNAINGILVNMRDESAFRTCAIPINPTTAVRRTLRTASSRMVARSGTTRSGTTM